MKKTLILSSILTLMIIFLPAFLVNIDDVDNKIDPQTIDTTNKEETSKLNLFQDDITTFSSNTSFKKTFYISGSRVNVYEDNSGKDKILRYLKENDVIVAYKESNGYIYCEDNNGNFGWIRKNKDNLEGKIEKNTQFKIDISLTDQQITVYKDNKNIKEIQCSTGIIGDPDTETPIGIFEVQTKGSFFFSTKYNEGAKYYIKFFSNYLIHSIPTDKNGNIIEEEKNKLGFPVSHGCIRIPMEDSKWLYDNVPVGSAVEIHY